MILTRAELRRIFNLRHCLAEDNTTDKIYLFKEFLAGAEAVGGFVEWNPFSKKLPAPEQKIVVRHNEKEWVVVWSNQASALLKTVINDSDWKPYVSS